MNIRIAIIFGLLFNIQISFSQDKSIETVFENTNEIYLKCTVSNLSEVALLSTMISIDSKTKGLDVYAYCNKKQYTIFSKLGYEFEILQHPGTLLKNPRMKADVNLKETNDWDYYPTYDAYVSMMNQFATDYPNICQVYSIGETVEGRSLLAARISDNIGVEEGDAKVLYTATMHGDETAGYVLSLRLIDYLLSNYGSNDRITNMVDGLDIFINPLANPDGTFADGNASIYGATRSNANWVDLNRNYPDLEEGAHPDGESHQPETIAFMNFAYAHQFVLSSNWHGGAEVFNYPWDTWEQLPVDDAWWYYIGREWADTVHDNSSSSYFNALDNGVTNGYEWYSISGGRQDYMNGYHQCREFTLELSNDKMPSASELPELWDAQYNSFLLFLEQALYGVRGTVTDATTGEPLLAKIYVENHDDTYSFVNSDENTGKYYRPIYQGNYYITYSAPEYISQTINVSATSHQATVLDVQLLSVTAGLEELNLNNIKTYPNPALNIFTIQTNFPLDLVQIIDTRGVLIHSFSKEEINAKVFDVSTVSAGVYFIKLRIKDKITTVKLLIE